MKCKCFLIFGLLLAIVFLSSPVYASSLLYAMDENNTLTIIDSTTNGVITSFTIGNGRWAIPNPAGTYVYVSDRTGDKIYKLKPGTNTVEATINVAGVMGMDITSDGNTMYAAMWDDDKVAVIDLRTNTVRNYISVGDDPYSVTISPDDSKVYVSNYNVAMGAGVSVISTSSNTVTGGLSTGETGAGDIVVSDDGSKIFVAYDKHTAGNGIIAIYNGNTNAWIANIDMSHLNYMGGLELDPTGQYVWVCNFDGVGFSGYSTDDYSLYKEVTIDSYGPSQGATDIIAVNNNLYISRGDNITVYDLDTGAITSNITTEAGKIYHLSAMSTDNVAPDLTAQPVYMYVHSYYVLRWENVTLSVYDNNGTLLDSKQTDNNGAATFNLVPGSLYTFNAYSASLGINTTVNYTVPNSYSGSIQQGITVLPYTSWLNPNYSGGMTNVNNTTTANASFASGYQDRDIFLTTNTSRAGTTGYVNSSYNDLSRLTTAVTFYLYKLNVTSNNYSVVQTAGFNLNTTVNSTWCNFTVTNVDASNRDYYVKAEASNSYYGNVTRNNPARIPWQSLLPGVPEQWHTYLAVIIVIGIFAASVMWLNGIISLVGAGAAYIFYSLGWLDTVPGAALGVTGAIIAAIVYYWSRRETGGLE